MDIAKKTSQKEIEKIMAAEGKARGVVFQTDWRYILEKWGAEALKKVEAKTKEWGFPIVYKKMNSFEWYPMGLRIISLLAIKDALDLNDKDIFEMGNTAPKFSIIVKMLFRYFISLKKTISQAPIYWQKHYTAGVLSAPEFHEQEKWLILRLKDIKIHPILCTYLAGYFLRMTQYTIKSPKIKIEETKCAHRGGPYHDFLVRWGDKGPKGSES